MNERKYPAINFSQNFIMFFLMICGVTVLNYIRFESENFSRNLFMLFIVIILDFSIILWIVYGLTSKVYINEETICKKSFLGKKCLRIGEIKGFFVFEHMDKVSIEAEENSLNKVRWLSTAFIVITNHEKFNPNSLTLKKEKGSLRFHYRKDLYEDLKATLKDIHP